MLVRRQMHLHTPVMLVNGLTRKITVSGPASVISAMFLAPQVSVLSECVTPFGRLVVPEVKRMTATSSRSGSGQSRPSTDAESSSTKCSSVIR